MNIIGVSAFYHDSACALGIPFVIEDPADGVLRLTYRQAPTCSDPITVRLNGTRLGDLPGAGQWSAVEFPVPRAMIRPGLNRLEVIWPPPPSATRRGSPGTSTRSPVASSRTCSRSSASSTARASTRWILLAAWTSGRSRCASDRPAALLSR